jgi:hypothetical protein
MSSTEPAGTAALSASFNSLGAADGMDAKDAVDANLCWNGEWGAAYVLTDTDTDSDWHARGTGTPKMSNRVRWPQASVSCWGARFTRCAASKCIRSAGPDVSASAKLWPGCGPLPQGMGELDGREAVGTTAWPALLQLA